MNIYILDGEWDFIKLDNGKTDGRPYLPQNQIVSWGWKRLGGNQTEYRCVNHKEKEPDFDPEEFQGMLYEADFLVMHNVKADLAWIRESGFIYDGSVWDTLGVEYHMQKSIKEPLDLSSCCERYGLEVKTDLVKQKWKEGLKTSEIDWDILEEYGINDIEITEDLFKAQLDRLGITIEELEE